MLARSGGIVKGTDLLEVRICLKFKVKGTGTGLVFFSCIVNLIINV